MGELQSAYDILKRGTLWSSNGKCKGYSVANPGEAARIDQYVASLDSGKYVIPPSLATDTGNGLVKMLDALAKQIDSAPPIPPTPTSPSGQPMPIGNIPGWTQVFADDFTTDVPLGSFPDSVADKWGAYQEGWTGTPTWGIYSPKRTTSFHDSMMDIWIHTDPSTNQRLITANEPKLVRNGDPNAEATYQQLYGRYAIRYKWHSFDGYKPSWLLWPVSETWPRDGEIDFPECDSFSSNQTWAFMHRQNGVDGGDQDGYNGLAAPGLWHTAVIEWLPTRCTFILDDKIIGQSTARIPNTPMRYVIQNGGSFNIPGPAPASIEGHIYIDWVCIYKPA